MKIGTCMIVVIGLVGCAGSGTSPPPVLPDPGPDGVYSLDWPDLGRGEERFITLDLGDDIETCRRVSPKFPFDSAKTRAQDRAQLQAFASCMNHESMVGRTVLLVGRADERGTSPYNAELGLKRAKRIKELLVQYGMTEGRIEVRSKGEAEAVGAAPEYSHGFDRRVDVVVRGGAHTPSPPKN